MEEHLRRGIEEFNTRCFFEAHDTWEELWMETRGSQRLFYQGLIQTSVGFYHLLNQNYKGACSQFGKALTKLEQYLPAHQGIDTQRLVERIRDCLNDAEVLKNGAAGQFDDGKIPKIHIIPASEKHN